MRDLAISVAGLLESGVEPDFGALPNRPNEIWRMVGDGSRSERLLGWRPTTTLAEGLRRTIDWYRRGPTPRPEPAPAPTSSGVTRAR